MMMVVKTLSVVNTFLQISRFDGIVVVENPATEQSPCVIAVVARITQTLMCMPDQVDIYCRNQNLPARSVLGDEVQELEISPD